MRIRGVKWTPEVNMLLIACPCGAWVEHRADRWRVRCASCGRRAHLGVLRDEWMTRHAAVRSGPSEDGPDRT